MTLVTVAASYGAGGSRVAPELARRLAVPFLERPHVPELDEDEEERACDERLSRGGLLSRMASVAVAWGTPAGLTAEELLPDEARRREVELEVREFAAAGRGVVLGRGAAVLLRDDVRALHVLLDGPEDARVEQAMAIEGIDRETAKRRRSRMDRFRRAYLEGLYGVDARDPGVFHLVLDSTAISLEDCVAIIADAARRKAGGAASA
jgi:Cytidylate kinase-like family